MTVDPDILREAMRRWATGVTIVSAQHNGQRHGMTVSSFTSVSLSPPLVLVSLEQSTRTHQLLLASGSFGVTILDTSQQEISDQFAGRQTEDVDRFAGLDTHTLVSGAPILDQYLTSLDCRVVSKISMGTHTIFIGEVIALEVNNDQPDPLIYFNRDYRQLQE
jgi:flavin reductase (DIM6/NTAB) family NADH-FMN oxidoreductase RutF